MSDFHVIESFWEDGTYFLVDDHIQVAVFEGSVVITVVTKTTAESVKLTGTQAHRMALALERARKRMT
jgi:hypothetical protein